MNELINEPDQEVPSETPEPTSSTTIKYLLISGFIFTFAAIVFVGASIVGKQRTIEDKPIAKNEPEPSKAPENKIAAIPPIEDPKPKAESAKPKEPEKKEAVWADDILRDAWTLPRAEVERKYPARNGPNVIMKGPISKFSNLDNGMFIIQIDLPSLDTKTDSKKRYVLVEFFDDTAFSNDLREIANNGEQIGVYGFFNNIAYSGTNADDPFSLIVFGFEVHSQKYEWRYDKASKRYQRKSH